MSFFWGAQVLLSKHTPIQHLLSYLGHETLQGSASESIHCRRRSLELYPLEKHYPLPRNQYLNNSPRNLSCIRAGANAGACIRPKMNSPKILANLQRMIPQQNTFFLCSREYEYRPCMCSHKKIPGIFSCMYWFCFVPGGTFSGQLFCRRASLTSQHISWEFCRNISSMATLERSTP